MDFRCEARTLTRQLSGYVTSRHGGLRVRLPVKLRCGVTVLSLAAGLGAGGSADATPPEGCVGFPDNPALFVCITRFTPTSAVPTVGQGPAQTYTIPEFCVFECFGPTPVSVPNVTVANGDGVIAEITYNGATYPAVVPAESDVAATVQQAQQTIANVVGTLLGIADSSSDYVQSQVPLAIDNAIATANSVVTPLKFTFNGTATIGCYGCGWYGPAGNSLSAIATGIVDGRTFVNAWMSATFTVDNPVGTTCIVSGAASGTMAIGSVGTLSFTWTMTGSVLRIAYTMSDGSFGTATAAFLVTSPVGNPCGGAVTASFVGSTSP